MMSQTIDRAIERRGVAIGLIVVAGLLGCWLYASYLTNVGVAVSMWTIEPAIALLVDAVAVYLVTEKFGVRSDPVLLAIVLVLSAVGLTFAARFAQDGAYAQHQFVGASISLALVAVVAVFIRKRGVAILVRHKYVFVALIAFLLVAPMLSDSVYGVHNWFWVGPVAVDASLWSMLFGIIFIASIISDEDFYRYLGQKSENASEAADGTEWLSLLMLFAIPLIAMYEFSTTTRVFLLLLCIAAMLYVGAERRVLALVPIIVLVTSLVVRYAGSSYIRKRYLTWMNPQSDPWGSGYQALQSLAAVKRGGLFGAGVGLGTPDLVPMSRCDYVFAAICEELGAVGGVAVACLFGLFVVRSLSLIGRGAGDAAAPVVVGVTCLTAIEALSAMGCATGLLPAAGVMLPYVSYGLNIIVILGVRLGLVLGLTSTTADGEGLEPGESERVASRVGVLARILAFCFVAVAVHTAFVVLS